MIMIYADQICPNFIGLRMQRLAVVDEIVREKLKLMPGCGDGWMHLHPRNHLGRTRLSV